MSEHVHNNPPSSTSNSTNSGDAIDVIKELVESNRQNTLANIQLQRRSMWFSNIRAGVIALALVLGPVIYFWGLNDLLSPERFDDGYAAMIRIDGEIDSKSTSSARKIVAALDSAYEDDDAEGIVLLINSPGGSPVQSSIIHDHILRLKSQHPDKQVIAVGEDYVASGAYWIATAADEIFVNRSTMTGSIGVVLAGFGLQHLVDALEIERRVITAGEHKLRMDMYRPLHAEDRTRIEELVAETHEHFIEAVRKGRGDRLCADDQLIFSGDIWSGEEAKVLCLVDGFGSLYAVVKDKFGVNDVKDYTLPGNLLDKFTSSIGVAVGRQLGAAATPGMF